MAMPQPDIISFCFLPKKEEIWDYKTKKNLWFTLSVCTLFFVYALLGFRYLYRHQFFSISWKLTSLFLLANLVPIIILGFITNKYIENKRISLKNELTDELERSIREFDLNYNYLLEDYTIKLNNCTDDISKELGSSTEINQREMNRLSALFDEVTPSSLFLVASSGEVLIARNSENSSALSHDLASSLGKSLLTFLNDKPVIIEQKNFYTSIFNPQVSAFFETFIKNIRQISEIYVGNSMHYFYFYPFGNKESFNNNFILMLMWNSKAYQNSFMKEKINLLYKSFPNADFCIKSTIESLFYGSEDLKSTLDSILEKQTNESEKIIGNIEFKGKKHIFLCVNGSNLKYCNILAVYPEELINKKIHLFIFQVIVGALASFLLTIIIGQLLTIQFLKPIQNLGEATSALGERNFSYRLPIGDEDEFGHLNQVFNRVIDGLEDFEVAKIIQESLMPSNNYTSGDFELFAKTIVMKTLGGNYYDCFKIDDKYLGIIIADVAGQGIPAGLMMAMAKSAVLTAPEEIKLNPALLTTRLHKMFFAIKNNKLKRMMTFQYFVLNVENGHFIYTNAGHNYPIIVDNNTHKANFINYNSIPLGVTSKCQWENREFDLNKGQSLVLYTFGIVNEKNINGEPLGYERFLENLPNHYDVNPENFYYNIFNKIYKQWSVKTEDDL
ncbi:MAG: SpoIIE family protein phosphatase, partial [Candidatus Riflebacteria bacterium]|nr:SpoIIE family protein phosphatase [Candidatus Riflebacteria bacterium]